MRSTNRDARAQVVHSLARALRVDHLSRLRRISSAKAACKATLPDLARKSSLSVLRAEPPLVEVAASSEL